MSADRELLALAAKAAGKARAEWDYDWLLARDQEVARDMLWDPRRDDGQALATARRLRMTIAHEPSRGGWSVGAVVDDEFMWLASEGDQRLAIFLAAAEIGRSMP